MQKFSQNPPGELWHPRVLKRRMPLPICWGRWKAQQKKGAAKLSVVALKESLYICVVYLQYFSETIFSTWTWNIGIETHCPILQWNLAPPFQFGTEGVYREVLSNSVHLMSVVFAHQIREPITRWFLVPRKMRSQSSVGFGENIHKLKISGKTMFRFWWVKNEEMIVATARSSKRPEEREFVADPAVSVRMYCKKTLRARRDLDGKKDPETRQSVLTANGEVHTFSSSQCKYSRNLLSYCWARFAKITDTLYAWVSGSLATIDQKIGKYLQDRQFRTSCRSRLICGFWKQVVFNKATTGIVGTRCTLGQWKQGYIKFIFGFSIRATWRTCHLETGGGISERWQERCGRSVGRSAILIGGCQEKYLKVTELLASTHSSRGSNSEHPPKLV